MLAAFCLSVFLCLQYLFVKKKRKNTLAQNCLHDLIYINTLSSKDLRSNKTILVTVRYDEIFIKFLHVITIYATIQHNNVFSKQCFDLSKA